MTQPFRFAHISDIHLPTTAADCTHLAGFLNKRFFSCLSWFVKRRFIHNKDVTDSLVKDCLAHKPDHILVTGDLTNLSLPGEYTRALTWLQSLGSPQDVTAIPGNHDLLLDTPSARHGLAKLSPYMQGGNQSPHTDFPITRRIQDVLFIGLSSSIETPIGWCSGRLGSVQQDRLHAILDKAAQDNLCRIVALHHPPAGPQKPRGGLEDYQDFAQIIAESGAELILHGHTHRSSMHALPGPVGPVPVLGVASLSVDLNKGYPVGCWHEYGIQREQSGWAISLDVHRYAGAGQPTEIVTQALLRSA